MANCLKRSLGVLLAISSLHVSATTVTISDNEWHAFDIDVEFPGTAEAGTWMDITDGSPLFFSFTLTDTAVLRVVDGGWSGDTFQVFSNGSSLGTTSPATNNVLVDPLPTTQAGFDAAWGDSNFSKASYVLSPGTYSVTGSLVSSSTFDGEPLNVTVGAVMLAPVPEPSNVILLLAGLGVIAARIRSRRSV